MRRSLLPVDPLKLLSLILSPILLLFGPSGWGQVVAPIGDDYRILEVGRNKYIFSSQHRDLIPGAISRVEAIQSLYSREFNWTLDERTAYIFASKNTQFDNAFATVIPNNMTSFYGNGLEFVDDSATGEWVEDLIHHETAHLYQLNPKDPLSSSLKTAFGNSPIFFFYIPIFVIPNIFIPTFLVEGNATYNESRFQNGGRLFSGHYQALALRRIQSPEFDISDLMNDHLDFPFGAEKYILGAHFMAYLANRFGTDKVNLFFRAQATHYLNPFLLNSTFKQVFGKGYKRLFKDFKRHHMAAALAQVSAPGETIQRSLFYGPLNSNSEEIFFLSTREGRSPPLINRVRRSDLTRSATSKNLPFGKLFLIDGEFWARSSESPDGVRTRYGLFGENSLPQKRYLGTFLHDHLKGADLITPEGFELKTPHLFLNGTFVDSTHSMALLGPDGKAYYFKQIGKERVLFRSGEELLRLPTYYAKLVDVNSAGEVFFVGPSPLGSTLYGFSPSGLQRLSPSDLIVDAREISAGRFLVVEVTEKNYVYKITESQPTSVELTAPTELQPPQVDLTLAPPNPRLLEKDEPYSPLRELRFSHLSPFFLGTESGLAGGLSVQFIDPLMFNNIFFSYGRGLYEEQRVSLSYARTSRPLAWYLGVSYDQDTDGDFNDEDEFKVEDYKYYLTAYAGYRYPLWKRGILSLGLTQELGWSNDPGFEGTLDEFYNLTTSLGFSRTIYYPLSYLPYRGLSLDLSHRIETNARGASPQNDLSLIMDTNYDLGKENFLSLKAGAGFSESGLLEVTANPTLGKKDFFAFSRLSPGSSTRLRETEFVGLTYRKVINWSYYFTKFPLSIRRFAPFGAYQYFYERQGEEENRAKDYGEWAYGLEVELLFFHMFPSRVVIAEVGSEDHLNPTHLISVGGQWSF